MAMMMSPTSRLVAKQMLVNKGICWTVVSRAFSSDCEPAIRLRNVLEKYRQRKYVPWWWRSARDDVLRIDADMYVQNSPHGFPIASPISTTITTAIPWRFHHVSRRNCSIHIPATVVSTWINWTSYWSTLGTAILFYPPKIRRICCATPVPMDGTSPWSNCWSWLIQAET